MSFRNAADNVVLPAYGSVCRVPVLALTTPLIAVPLGMVMVPLANAVPRLSCTPPDSDICSLLRMEQVPLSDPLPEKVRSTALLDAVPRATRQGCV